MSKLPQLNLRISPDHHPLIRRIAERLRERDGAAFASDLAAFLGDREAVPQMDLGELAARLAEVERRLAEMAPKSTTKRLTRTSPKAKRTSSEVA